MPDADTLGAYDASGDVMEMMRGQLKEAMVIASLESLENLRTAIEAAKEIGLENDELQPATKLCQQLEADAAPATFTDLPRDKMEQLQASTSRSEALAILLPCLRLRLEDGFQSEIVAEFHYHNFMFCQKNSFCTEKASTMISILHALHKRAIVQEKLVEQKARELFEVMLGKHTRQLPPYSIGVFTPEDEAAIRQHTEQSLFRHYAMHAFVAHQRQDLVVKVSKESAAPAALPFAPVQKRSAADLRDAAVLNATLTSNTGYVAEETVAANGQPTPPATGTEADVHRAVEEALEAHLHRFEPPSL